VKRLVALVRSPAFAGLVSRGAGMAGAFAMSVAILRSLAPADAGLVVLVYTLLTIAAVLARFGADNLALREVSKDPSAAAPLIRDAFRLPWLLSPVVAVLLVGAVVLQSDASDALWVGLAAGVGVLPAALSFIAGAVLRGLGWIASGTMAELGSPVLLAAAGIAALGLTGHASALAAVCMMSGAYLATALWSWGVIWRAAPLAGTRGAGTRPFLRRFRGSLVAFFTSTMGFFLFTWMPVLALGYVIANEAVANTSVAQFNAASRIAQFVVLVPTIQISYLSQQFARLHHERDLASVSRIAQSATRAAVLWGVALTAIMVAAPQLALSVFGDYADAATTLRILAIGGLLVAAIGPVNGLMLTCGYERQAGRFTLALLAASAVVLPLLTRWGAEGVAAGSALVSISYALACYITLRRGGIDAALPRRGRPAPTAEHSAR
jgi:O-antigen/teichoic acid export membrane protein